jgi:tRNA threonylcarbamoyladenosine biosynthesis protein TsaE
MRRRSSFLNGEKAGRIVVSAERSSVVLISKSPAETFRIGRILGKGLKGGDVVTLTGELGSGKTCLTQGIACGLGVPDNYTVTSPTFTLINEYPGREAVLYHLDLYRLEGPAGLADIGYEEYLAGGGVVVIEWAEKIREAVPDGAVCVALTYLDEERRKIEISAYQERIGFWERTLKGNYSGI